MTQKPKLMLFSHVSHKRSITGAEKLLLHFCQEMRPYFSCVLVVPSEGMISLLARKNGIRVKIQPFDLLHNMYTPYNGIRYEADQLMKTSSSRNVINLIRKESPQMVLTNTCVNAVPAMAARILNIPVIWKITETIQMNDSTAEAVQIIDDFSDWVIGISQTVLEPLQHGSIPEKSTILCPTWDASHAPRQQWNLLRAKRRSHLGLTSKHFCVGYISTFIYGAKGLKSFIRSALTLCERYPHTRYWIIGNPADEAYYHECLSLISKSGYSHQFLFTPFLVEVSEAYCAMDLTVVPSVVKEGFGMTALESLYYATPVVAFGQGGLQEMMMAVGSPHLLVEPGNEADLALKMENCIQNPKESRLTGERCKVEVERVYGPAAYSARAAEMVQELMNRLSLPERVRTHTKHKSAGSKKIWRRRRKKVAGRRKKKFVARKHSLRKSQSSLVKRLKKKKGVRKRLELKRTRSKKKK
ncbi:glycosyltransferase [Paenibacillus sp. Marseille-Q4541]|uniref:glycosyltransferase n=1 Tax=Paenibacillus sp. Marseille-Q4541 TaxID=2831522 RepID=UPI001BA479D6|nr:glycosyltransferase [Paenibacillus sp. Marseille-Q4541]